MQDLGNHTCASVEQESTWVLLVKNLSITHTVVKILSVESYWQASVVPLKKGLNQHTWNEHNKSIFIIIIIMLGSEFQSDNDDWMLPLTMLYVRDNIGVNEWCVYREVCAGSSDTIL